MLLGESKPNTIDSRAGVGVQTVLTVCKSRPSEGWWSSWVITVTPFFVSGF